MDDARAAEAATAEPQARRIALPGRGGSVAALAFGPGERPFDVIFSHANGFNARTYRTILGPLADRMSILAYDLRFYDMMGKLSPNPTAKESWSQKSEPELLEAALRNSSLQGGYFIMAARALGLDCGPMSGFNNEGVDKEFFAGTRIKSYFLCNLGYGEISSVRPRAARLGFDEACKIL